VQRCLHVGTVPSAGLYNVHAVIAAGCPDREQGFADEFGLDL
jgi:hypothetical protein